MFRFPRLRRHPVQDVALGDLIAELFNVQDPTEFHAAADHASSQLRRGFRSLEEALLGVKLINLAIVRYEYRRRSVATIGRPVGFMMDTANQCQLGCPSCMNTVNTAHSEATFNQWPRGLMAPETYKSFLGAVGLSAFTGHFYNNHEPFLNKSTPDFIRAAVDLRIETFVSSNLSFAKFDAEAVVRSGLRELMVAIDGTTQEAYEKYRKRGRLDWVLANAKSIAETKAKLGSPTPYLRWQFLTFAHNVHQVEDAVRLAKETGFDTFNVATPYAVEQDDPNVHSIEYDGPSKHRAIVFNQRINVPFSGDLEPYREMILGRLAESAIERRQQVARDDFLPDASAVDRCDWLHLAVIGDAMGRIVPCCLGDYKGQGKFIFANVASDANNIMNSPAYREARLFLANRQSYHSEFKDLHPRDRSRCVRCPVRPLPQIGLGALHAYLVNGSNAAMSSLPKKLVRSLHDWSEHRETAPRTASRA